MPDIRVGAQIFDLVFHPSHRTVYTGLLTGEIKAFTYDDQGDYQKSFSLKVSKRSCRGLSMNSSGDRLYSVGKGKTLHMIDTATGKVVDTRKAAHDVAINRVKSVMPNMLATGDDDGVIKFWDPRKPEALRSYTHHFDFISDFLWLEDKKHLVATSGDGTLSVLDVRSKKTEPFAQSEDQEDELLSLVSIKGGQKIVVGTQLGILSIFNRKSGWGDCVDRIPGHPHSIDALCNIPPTYPSAHSTILTGSSDGLLRAVQLLPTKLLGVVADHGDFPIERIAVDLGCGESSRWVGSVGHEEVLKLTDLREVFEDEDEDGEESEEGRKEGDDDEGSGKASEGESDEEESESEKEEVVKKDKGKGKAVKATSKAQADLKSSDSSDDDSSDSDDEDEPSAAHSKNKSQNNDSDSGSAHENEQEADSDSDDSDVVREKKRKKKRDPDPMQAKKKKKGRNEIDADPSFFADL
ncbi:WD40 repeat-like protein [Panus rudis PR-1116 ss-1]|nr:WD40 repeat-like protein [Panus rudis PR-1116 ss-1]